MDSARKACAIAVVIFAFGGAVFAAGLDQGKQLSNRYKDQVLSLRHPLMSQHQDYELDGRPVTPAQEGPWTLYGRIRITEIVEDGKQLQLKGTRVLCEYTKNGLELVRDKEKVTVTVRLNGPLASEEDAIAALGRVFALTPQEIVNSAPDYWHDFLVKDLLGGPGPKKQTLTANPPRHPAPSDPGSTTGDAKDDAAKDKVFHIGEANVQAPRPQYAPEPEFTERARKMRFDGVVGMNVIVDKTGRITAPRIVHALGLGMDENAIASVRQWKFTPGMRDGQPVAVAVYVEVDFHLYKK